MADFAAARQHMVDSQIRTNKVTDASLIAALSEVPRERFVDRQLQGVAYIDQDLPIGGGRCVMEPMVFARMVQCLDIGPEDVVLDVGCASGYSSAVVARLASTVFAVEADEALARQATRNFADLGIDNVVVVEGSLKDGYPAQAPYDVILLEGAIPEIPPGLADQLAEGGRLCAVIDDGRGAGQAVLMIRRGGVLARRAVFDAHVALLPGFEAGPGFVF